MHEKFNDKVTLPEVPFDSPTLTYEKPELGVNYWVVDDFFDHSKAVEISNRCFNKSKWILGKPYTQELWPGMRTKKALKNIELSKVESWVKEQLNKQTLWVEESQKVVVNSNWAILVGSDEGEARPHVDNRQLCEYGAVLYLSQNPKPDSGTSFYRLKYKNGAAGGNLVKAPYHNLVDALKTDSLPPDSWYQDIEIENKFNRLILFKGNMVHSASSYFGKEKRDKRLAVTFFWRTE
jgi:hypothetical protein